MTLNLFNRKPKTLARIERLIEIGAFIMLVDGRYGTLDSIEMVQGEKRGYVIGDNFAASITDNNIFAFRNVEYALAA